MEDTAFLFAELHEIPVSLYLQLVKSLSGPVLQEINFSHSFGIDHKFAESSLCPAMQVTNEDIKYYWCQY